MSSNITQSLFRKNDVSTSKLSNQNELLKLLELLNATNDVKLQVKLFSALSAYLMFNKGVNFNIVIKSSAVYDKIQGVLVNGLPRRAACALNFLSALLYVGTEEDGASSRKSLALYARNMTRISGCLATMADMFTDCMMYHDTWKALCQCLTIACSDCEPNQSYCTHLIPACIKKCNQTNMDIFLLLQSLVFSHDRNLQLFLDQNGLAVFTRELLHYDKCLQLLITVVQSAKASCLLLRETQVLHILRDFLRLYGSDSQIGQKAMIILNHIESRSRGEPQIPVMRNEEKAESQDHINSGEVENKLDDTKTLLRNIMKEFYEHKKNEIEQLKKSESKFEVNSLIRGNSSIFVNSKMERVKRKTFITNKCRDHHGTYKLHRNKARDLSFSFLPELELDRETDSRCNNYYKNYNTAQCKGINNTKTITFSRNTPGTLNNINKDLSYLLRTIAEEKPTLEHLNDFRPMFSSTPKSKGYNSNETNFSEISKCMANITKHSLIPQQRMTKIKRRSPSKVSRNVTKKLRNTSLSSRLFSAINESCTTLVKNVASIFKKKEPSCSPKDSMQSQSFGNDNRSCSFSFFRYMQKRDAVNNLPKRRNKGMNDFSITKSSETRQNRNHPTACETCNNTEVLKQKLAKDDQLRRTVKKLKLGINLYGCDFKKISRTMWPRETYMTPSVLYSLYRKLLMK